MIRVRVRLAFRLRPVSLRKHTSVRQYVLYLNETLRQSDPLSGAAYLRWNGGGEGVPATRITRITCVLHSFFGRWKESFLYIHR